MIDAQVLLMNLLNKKNYMTNLTYLITVYSNNKNDLKLDRIILNFIFFML